MLKVRLYRPFSAKHFLEVLPQSVQKLAVMDRTKEPGSLGEPLYQDVCTVFAEIGQAKTIVGGRYGLGSKEFTPSMVKAIFDNLKLDEPKNHFTVGITRCYPSCCLSTTSSTPPEGVVPQVRGIGSDGTVAPKNSIDHRRHTTLARIFRVRPGSRWSTSPTRRTDPIGALCYRPG